jgi:ubiquitin-protein ligase E3 C
VPDGANVAVERGNVVRYIHFMANHRLNVQLRAQSAAFLRGFQDLVKPQWIKMFDEEELQVRAAGTCFRFRSTCLRFWFACFRSSFMRVCFGFA